MPAIDVVSDANVALKWFLSAEEEQVGEARELLHLHRDRRVLLHVLDLTLYEVGNALLRGRAPASAEQTAVVITALQEICVVLTPTAEQLTLACEVATDHELTLYDATYVAVAVTHRARLVTLDHEILHSGRASTPGQLVRDVAAEG